jgi:hypothetical protein
LSADTVSITGSNGANGANGIAGNPGTTGGNGFGGGFANAFNHNTVDFTNEAFAFGGMGGNGGQGGDGIGSGAVAGNGGNGGNGGDANSDAAVSLAGGALVARAQSSGGRGGDGGFSGNATILGMGGNAGFGGHATSISSTNSTTHSTESHSYSQAGNGGAGFSGGSGGQGGNASADAFSQSSGALTTARVTSFAQGGQGGVAFNANGANGGNAFAAATVIGTENAFLDVQSIGATGSETGIGNGGNGGTASLGAISASANNVTAFVTVQGGLGGGANQEGDGGQGASVSLSTTAATINANGQLFYDQRAYSGAGGKVSRSGFVAGNGGSSSNIANLNQAVDKMQVATIAVAGIGGASFGDGGITGFGGTAYAEMNANNSKAGGRTSASTIAVGGAGGISIGDGFGKIGSDGSAKTTALANTFCISNASAGGGAGGGSSGAFHGASGGNATVFATATSQTATANSGAAERDALCRVIADGGNGGDSYGSGNGGTGGTVISLSCQAIGPAAQAISDLEGGDGGSAFGTGNGGAGADLSFTNTASFVTSAYGEVDQFVRGGNGGGATASGATAGSGGDAVSIQNVNANLSSQLYVASLSYGGEGGWHNNSSGMGGQGGFARSVAIASNATGNAKAFSFAESGRGGLNNISQLRGVFGDAEGTSTATSSNLAYAQTDVYGRNAISTSTASGTQSSESVAYAIGQSNGPILLNSNARSLLRNTANTEAFSSTTGVFRSLSNAATMESFLYSTTNASDPAYVAFVGNNPNNISAFGIQTTAGIVEHNVLAASSFGLKFSDNGKNGVSQFGEINLIVEWQEAALDGQELILGLLNPQISNSGITNWSMTIFADGTGFSQSWNSTTTNFLTLFGDNVIQLGIQDWSTTGSSKIEIHLEWNAKNSNAMMRGNFLLGSIVSVPEPSLGVFGLVLLATGISRCRKRSRQFIGNA